MIEDEMVGWHHQLNGHEFEQTQGDRRTGEPGMLQSMELQRVGHNLVIEQETGMIMAQVWISVPNMLLVLPRAPILFQRQLSQPTKVIG